MGKELLKRIRFLGKDFKQDNIIKKTAGFSVIENCLEREIFKACF
jgi:hypothetical protein